MNKRSHYLRLICEAGVRKSFKILGYRIFYGKRSATQSDMRIKRVMSEWVGLYKYWDNAIDLEALALAADVQREDISHFLKKFTSTKLMTMRKELRLEDAKELLLEKMDVSASSIGKMVGINDKTDFRRQFREYVGMNPAEWREAHKEALLGK